MRQWQRARGIVDVNLGRLARSGTDAEAGARTGTRAGKVMIRSSE